MPRAAGSKFSKVYRSQRPAAAKTLARAYATRPVRKYNLRGRGGYWDNVKARWAAGGGSMKPAFQAAGNILGGPAGGQVGGLVNRALYALTGFGDYKIHTNALLEETNGPPAIINRSNKEFVVRHREYITDVYSASGTAGSPSTFGILSYPINPGDSKTFPWLSTVADKFEQYRIEGMVFEYKSLYSDAVVTQNGSIGSVVLATEYNAGAPPFSSKQAMENYQFAQSAKPSMSILHPIECANKQNVLSELYIRPADVPANEDVKTYDFGDFQIASQGIPLGTAGAAVNLGELWVSYQIALIKPRIPTASSAYKDSGFAYFRSTDIINPSPAPWGTSPVPILKVEKGSRTNIPIELTSNDTFVVECGSTPMTYEFELAWYATNPSATALWRAPAAVLTNATFVNSSSSGSYQNVRLPTALSLTNGCTSRYFIQVPAATPSAPVATVQITSSTFGADQANPMRFEMFVNAVPTPLN